MAQAIYEHEFMFDKRLLATVAPRLSGHNLLNENNLYLTIGLFAGELSLGLFGAFMLWCCAGGLVGATIAQ